MENFAPIILFVYNRPDHTRKTVDALRANFLAKMSELFIFSDGPGNETACVGVMQVRDFIKTVDGFARVKIIERDRNWGLAKSIIDGVTQVVNEYGKVVVLEDDLITSPYFLNYMNDALDMYENVDGVASINAYMYPLKGLPEMFFLRSSDCWGWGTWKRAWQTFEPDGTKLLREITRKKLVRAFNMNGYYPYLRMLQDQIAGRNDSWAIRWAASTLLSDKLGLYPGRSLVMNIGIDGTGQHCGRIDVDNYCTDLTQEYAGIEYKKPEFDNHSCIRIGKYMAKNIYGSFLGRLLMRVKQFFKDRPVF